MSAQLSKTDLAFKLATSQSYIDHSYDPTPLPAVQPAPRGVLRQIGDAVAFVVQRIQNWSARQTTLSEMGLMSDRELADIGVGRGDLPRVFDPDFVTDHTRRRVSY